MRYYLADLLSNFGIESENEKNKNYVLRQPFRTVGEQFEVFEQNTIDVLVPYKDGKELIDELFRNEGKWKFIPTAYENILKKTKKYTVNLYEWQKKELDKAGMIFPVLEGRMLVLGKEAYDDKYGLTILKELQVDNFIL